MENPSPEMPFAKLYGEALLECPKDLYIPPKALSLLLEAFEGPLDLLLYLIKKSNIDILDIPMASLTEQYLNYIEVLEDNFELASDYLAMAAYLIEIKSRLLLPKPIKNNAEEIEEDPRAELARRLLEYESFKKAAENLNALPRNGRDFFKARVGFEKQRARYALNLFGFQNAWQHLLEQQKLNAAHQVEKEVWSVREHMHKIIEALEKQNPLLFSDLLNFSNIFSAVAYFVAVLELAKENVLAIEQEQSLAPILLNRI